MFQLTPTKYEILRCQIGTSSSAPKNAHGGARYLPFVFTQEGVAMLSSVLSSSHAIHVNITIMRAFVKLREILESHADLAKKIDLLERKSIQHDYQLKAVFEAIRQLISAGAPPTQKKVKALSQDRDRIPISCPESSAISSTSGSTTPHARVGAQSVTDFEERTETRKSPTLLNTLRFHTLQKSNLGCEMVERWLKEG